MSELGTHILVNNFVYIFFTAFLFLTDKPKEFLLGMFLVFCIVNLFFVARLLHIILKDKRGLNDD